MVVVDRLVPVTPVGAAGVGRTTLIENDCEVWPASLLAWTVTL